MEKVLPTVYLVDTPGLLISKNEMTQTVSRIVRGKLIFDEEVKWEPDGFFASTGRNPEYEATCVVFAIKYASYLEQRLKTLQEAFLEAKKHHYGNMDPILVVTHAELANTDREKLRKEVSQLGNTDTENVFLVTNYQSADFETLKDNKINENEFVKFVKRVGLCSAMFKYHRAMKK